jgi:hypothetical protein
VYDSIITRRTFKIERSGYDVSVSALIIPKYKYRNLFGCIYSLSVSDSNGYEPRAISGSYDLEKSLELFYEQEKTRKKRKQVHR